MFFFFFKQKTAYEMRISDWSSDVCSSDLGEVAADQPHRGAVPDIEPGTCVQAPEIGLIRPRRQRLGAVITARIDRIARERERLIAQVRDIGRADIARPVGRACRCAAGEILRSRDRSEEHTSELQSLMRTSYAVFC